MTNKMLTEMTKTIKLCTTAMDMQSEQMKDLSADAAFYKRYAAMLNRTLSYLETATVEQFAEWQEFMADCRAEEL